MFSVSGKIKQLSSLGSTLRENLSFASEITCFKNKMSACFNSVKDEECFVRRTRKPSAEFCHNFEQQPEGKAMLKSKFCRQFKEMKENNFTIVQ